MKSRAELALKKRQCGYNCAQAVACSYCDLVKMDEDTVFRILEGFGTGMGNMEQTCGAVSAVAALAGMKYSEGKDNPVSKAKTYKFTKEILNAFKEKNQSVVCGELKGVKTGKVLRDCPGCITDAAEIAEKILFDDL